MEHVTVGKRYNKGKIALCQCVAKETLENIHIINECFLLLILQEGTATFNVGDDTFTAIAPCFVCFNELEEPKLLRKSKLKCSAVYFHPKFLNVNMCFGLLRSGRYGDIAQNHDMFLLKPFIDNNYVVPITAEFTEKIMTAFRGMAAELSEQNDWYWSCRGRSYFMEMIIALERMYSLLTFSDGNRKSALNSRIRDAILYIEGHYMERISISTISQVAGLNHTTLTNLFKAETGRTPMEYVSFFRIKIAKKQLGFTEVPIKDISYRCGFKTVQHFSRVFKAVTGTTPALYRRIAVKRRKDEIK